MARSVVAGFFTNMCVKTTARTVGNLCFDTSVVGDACATTNRVGPDRVDHDPKLIRQLSLGSFHREFCTVLQTADALALLTAGAPALSRAQGNEKHGPPPRRASPVHPPSGNTSSYDPVVEPNPARMCASRESLLPQTGFAGLSTDDRRDQVAPNPRDAAARRRATSVHLSGAVGCGRRLR